MAPSLRLSFPPFPHVLRYNKVNKVQSRIVRGIAQSRLSDST